MRLFELPVPNGYRPLNACVVQATSTSTDQRVELSVFCVGEKVLRLRLPSAGIVRRRFHSHALLSPIIVEFAMTAEGDLLTLQSLRRIADAPPGLMISTTVLPTSRTRITVLFPFAAAGREEKDSASALLYLLPRGYLNHEHCG
jgi:hypothetical protein